jgi:hypothetical protein
MRVAVVAVMVLIGIIGHPAASAWAQTTDPTTKLHFRLSELLTRELPLTPQDKGLVRIDDQGRVQVYITAEPATQSLLDEIVRVGGKVDGQGLGVIQAWVPVQALNSLAALPEVKYIRPPDYGHLNIGSVTTEGDTTLKASAVRQQFGVDGTGIRVGVISGGLKGLGQSIASGNLPPTTFFCQNAFAAVTQRPSDCVAGEKLIQTTGGITSTSFPPGTDIALNAEGTAMLEIVHDIAPGAQLWFVGWGGTTVAYAAAVAFLAPNVDIVVSDVAQPMFFPDGQNTFSQAIAQIMNGQGNVARAYIVSAGNFADKHYSGLYTDSGFSDGLGGKFHLFAANNQTTGPGTALGFNRFTVAPLTFASVNLTWNDPARASTNNYDLTIFDCTTAQIYDQSIQPQNGSQEPQEIAGVFNSSAIPLPVCYAIRNVLNQAAPRILNVVITGAFRPADHRFNTASMSVVSPADTLGDLIAVGAVNQAVPNIIEDFSSLGPTFDGRSKPDMVAVDGVTVSGAGQFQTPFFGTSAAAPHVAGIAALLLQLKPTLTRAQLKAVLQQGAVPLGDINTFGSGRVDALASANLLSTSTPTGVAAAILPASRSVQVGNTATVFATMAISGNTGGVTCGIALATNIPATFQYQTTNPATNQLTGTPNTPINIGPGGFQTFVISIKPNAAFPPTDVAFTFSCANASPASVLSGLNTLLLSASTTPTPDIVALVATPSGDGIVNIPGAIETGVFAVATVNVGAGGLITASADTGSSSLTALGFTTGVPRPLITICQTNPATGVCLGSPGPSVTTQINANATPTFAIFVKGNGVVPFDPGNNRITVRFKDGGEVTRGATSVAVRTQ